MEVLKPRCQNSVCTEPAKRAFTRSSLPLSKFETQFLLNQNELLTVLIHARLETAAPPSPTVTGIPYCPCTAHKFNLLAIA